jgi:hypothetical protein
MEESGKSGGDEKEKHDQAAEAGPETPPDEGIPEDLEIPQASFGSLVMMLTTTALGYLAEVENAEPKKKKVLTKLARHTVDMIQVLDEKTKGNLSEGEKKLIDRVLTDLRLQFIKHADLT